jgi:hypothetical protein
MRFWCDAMASPTATRQPDRHRSHGGRRHRHSRSRSRRQPFGWREAALVLLASLALGAVIFSIGFLVSD